MLASVDSAAVVGVDATIVHVEVDVSTGLPSFDIVGLPGTSVRESRERVRTAVKNAGFEFPLGRVTVNLAPAHLPKTDTFYDLPIAIGLLAASGQLSMHASAAEGVYVGELSLDGSIQPVRGALCIASSPIVRGRWLVAPEQNEGEIDAATGVHYVTASHLRELVTFITSGRASPARSRGVVARQPKRPEDPWAGIRGQTVAKRALEIAMAGGHHVTLMGPPGAGKSMLARRAAQLATPMSADETMDVSKVYSVAGLLGTDQPFIEKRPFRSPHHTVTPSGLLGGGTYPRPGEASLAHRGVLFLDELTLFRTPVLEGLREPMEDRFITISRVLQTTRFPADFILITALNPCPCGFLGDTDQNCHCSPSEIDRYRRRLSGPFVDRIDMFVRLQRVPADDMIGGSASSAEGAARAEKVYEAMARAEHARQARFANDRKNGDMTPEEINRYCALDDASRRFLLNAARRWYMSARAIHRTLKVARTIADMDGAEAIAHAHVAEALAYRKQSLFTSSL